jgi:hypothetical protein
MSTRPLEHALAMRNVMLTPALTVSVSKSVVFERSELEQQYYSIHTVYWAKTMTKFQKQKNNPFIFG